MADGVGGKARASAERLEAAISAVSRGLVEREVLVELVVLSAVAEEHLLVIGEPGTAKSEAVRRIAQALGGRYFEYLLGRFTEPSELFGPLDLLKLQQGQLETVTAGMLPEAEIAFLDEVFLGSTAILNTLLGILNERQFRRGNTALRVPLRLCVGASNALPSDPALAAFGDRFLTRVFVSAVPDTELEALLRAGLQAAPTGTGASLEDLSELVTARRAVDLGPVQSAYANAIRLLRRAGIALSDRRIVRTQNLIAAAAALAGRRAANVSDLWPLIYAIPTQAEQESARDTLRELLAESESSLSAAALDASSGPRARAKRLAEAATSLLEGVADSEDEESWKLRAEGILRELDASFPAHGRPEPLPALRERLIARLGATQSGA